MKTTLQELIAEQQTARFSKREMRIMDVALDFERENARLQMELDSSCNAEELRQVREDNKRLRECLQEMYDCAEACGWKNAEIENARRILLNDPHHLPRTAGVASAREAESASGVTAGRG
jgi:hypothetical protein